MSLIRKTAHGLFWASILSILLKIINFIISVILARLLEPQDFGLVTLGMMIVIFFDLFRDMGIGAALIHKKDNIDTAINTAFFLFPVVAILLYIISFLLAPLIAGFFNEPQLKSIIRVLSFIFIITSFWVLPNSLLDKNLEFRKKLIPLALPRIGYGIAAIGLALSGFGVWSLVTGWLVLQLMSILTLWSVVDWRPSYKFDKKIAIELISYGKYVVGANILVFLIGIVDVIFIGRFLGPENLGFYSIALGVAGLLTSQVSGIMASVMFPVYSTIQDNKDFLKKAYLKTIKYVSIITIPASFGISTIAWDFVMVVYGSKWLPAVAALQVLCFYGLNRSILATTEQLYLAAGKPRIRTKLNLLQLVLMGVLIYPFTIRYGIMGTAVAAMLPSLLIVVLTLHEAGKIIGEKFIYIARNFIPAIIGSLIMALAIWGWQDIAVDLSPMVRLAVSIIIGALVYVGYLWSINKEVFYGIMELLKKK